VLSAGAVAICGASAALAISSVLPSHKDHERNTIMTVAGVTALSTVAMVAYPVFVTYLQYDTSLERRFMTWRRWLVPGTSSPIQPAKYPHW
jgi:uncharacterized membrane protein YadS